MRRWYIVVGSAVVLAVAGCSQRGLEQLRPEAQPPADGSVLGVVWRGDDAALVRLDRFSLAPVSRRRVMLGDHASSWSFSPDRSRIVFGGENGVRFVDRAGLRLRGVLALPGGGYVAALAWPRRDRVLALAQSAAWKLDLFTIDPLTRRVLERTRINQTLVGVAKTTEGFVLLLGPRASIGPARLLVVGPDGSARSVSLTETRAGTVPIADPEKDVARHRSPGLAVDSHGRRALVVGAGEPVADVDLDTLRVTYHNVREPVSLFGRLRDWLEPEAGAKAIEGPERVARWVTDSLVAVSGRHDHASLTADAFWTTPAGLELIDVRDWTVRRLDDRATSFSFAYGMLLAYGATWDSRTQASVGIGLTAYGLDGKRRFHLFEEEPVSYVETAGPYAYVALAEGGDIPVVDLRSGRVVRTITRYANGVPQLVKPGAAF